jgi:hypothetical protein
VRGCCCLLAALVSPPRTWHDQGDVVSHNAYISSLSRLSEEDLPEELREEFSIYESASWLPPEAPEEGMMASPARHMTDEEVRELCRGLVLLFYEFVRRPDAP